MCAQVAVGHTSPLTKTRMAGVSNNSNQESKLCNFEPFITATHNKKVNDPSPHFNVVSCKGDQMGVTLYHFPPSAPSRGALLVAKALGIDIDVQIVDLFAKEQLTADFVKINPQHTVPTLVDGDFTVWDSHAIGPYLVRTYGKDDTMYPKDPKQKAVVDQRLYFDCGTLYPRIRQICFPVLFLGEEEILDEHKTSLDEALGFLDVFLDGSNFAAGKDLTVADCSLVASISSIVAVGWDITPYANVAAWLARCALTIPDYAAANQAGADQFGKTVRSKLAPGQI
jgi:glutathione S-transferase